METRALDERLFDDRGRRLLQGLYVCFNYNENVHALRPPPWTFDNYDRFEEHFAFRGWHFGLDSVAIRLPDDRVQTFSGCLGAIGHQLVLEIDGDVAGDDDDENSVSDSFLPRFISPQFPLDVRELLRNIRTGFNDVVESCACRSHSCGPCTLLISTISDINRYLDEYAKTLGIGDREPGLNSFAAAFDEADAFAEFESRTGLDDAYFGTDHDL